MSKTSFWRKTKRDQMKRINYNKRPNLTDKCKEIRLEWCLSNINRSTNVFF